MTIRPEATQGKEDYKESRLYTCRWNIEDLVKRLSSISQKLDLFEFDQLDESERNQIADDMKFLCLTMIENTADLLDAFDFISDYDGLADEIPEDQLNSYTKNSYRYEQVVDLIAGFLNIAVIRTTEKKRYC